MTMLFWEIRDEEGKCFGTETDFDDYADWSTGPLVEKLL